MSIFTSASGKAKSFGTRSKVGPKSRRSVKDSAVAKQNSYRAALEFRMIQLLVDENFNCRILRGLRRRIPGLNCLLVQDTELFQTEDPQILDWAAASGRVVLTHDVNTMTRYAYERLEKGEPLPGVIIVPKELSIGAAIEALEILLNCSEPEEFPNRVIHLP